MKIGWGWKITALYTSFVVLMLTLVIASTRQHFDLVSADYYKQEITYQDIIDADKNLAALSAPVEIYANEQSVSISFPPEFKDKVITGKIHFYSAADAKWDRTFEINATDNNISIPRNKLFNTRYTIKISCSVDGKKYYRESELQLPG
jgi:hypothetical protein